MLLVAILPTWVKWLLCDTINGRPFHRTAWKDTTCHLNVTFCITVFLPSPFYYWYSIYFCSIYEYHQFSHFVLVGHFNVHMQSASASFAAWWIYLQAVTEFTPCGKTSVIDLVLTTSPTQVANCASISPLAHSDYNGLNVTINWKSRSHHFRFHRRIAWRHAQADFAIPSRMITETDGGAFACEDVDQYCTQWQTKFL